MSNDDIFLRVGKKVLSKQHKQSIIPVHLKTVLRHCLPLVILSVLSPLATKS